MQLEVYLILNKFFKLANCSELDNPFILLLMKIEVKISFTVLTLKTFFLSSLIIVYLHRGFVIGN